MLRKRWATLAMLTVLTTSLSTAVVGLSAHSAVAEIPPLDYPDPYDWFRPIIAENRSGPVFDDCYLYGICP
ncbi:hypothetical protein [Streptosporangium sp. NPDC000509]|uniref:hypothetical protein n=1 Tax=Streptosporangium sp. NPDC000509 TaxID=3366186 RepID=UPI0036D01D72